MNTNNELLTAFLAVAVTRNGSIFHLDTVELNAYNNVMTITGNVTIDNVETPTEWLLDGSNRIHGYDYNLVKVIPVDEFINPSSN